MTFRRRAAPSVEALRVPLFNPARVRFVVFEVSVFFIEMANPDDDDDDREKRERRMAELKPRPSVGPPSIPAKVLLLSPCLATSLLVGRDGATDDTKTTTTRRVNNGAHFAPLVKYDKRRERKEETPREGGGGRKEGRKEGGETEKTAGK